MIRELIFTAIFSLLPACPTEDSSWCAWDAAEHGNGRGRSFFALTDSIVIYEVSK